MHPILKVCGCLLAAVALLSCLVTTDASTARDLTQAESAKLADTVKKFDAAMGTKDFSVLVKAIPPRIVKQMAERDGTTEAEINKALGDLIDTTMTAMPVQSFALKLPEALHKELADGTPYLLIPTDTVIDAGGANKALMRAPTLALLDCNDWYLLRTNDAQLVSILREAYPDYAGVEFPEATMEPVKE
jgi:hypothetical protein